MIRLRLLGPFLPTLTIQRMLVVTFNLNSFLFLNVSCIPINNHNELSRPACLPLTLALCPNNVFIHLSHPPNDSWHPHPIDGSRGNANHVPEGTICRPFTRVCLFFCVYARKGLLNSITMERCPSVYDYQREGGEFLQEVRVVVVALKNNMPIFHPRLLEWKRAIGRTSATRIFSHSSAK